MFVELNPLSGQMFWIPKPFYKYLSQNDIVALGVASKEISLCLMFTI